MIVCRSCGSHNADGDTFCGSCGDYLEWTGEKLEPASAKPAVAESEQSASEQRASEQRASEQRAAEQRAAEQRAAAALIAPVPPEADPDLRDRPAPAIPTPPSPVERKPQPEPLPPQPVRPRRPAAPVVTAPPTRRLHPEDLICGDCGEGNPPTRRFCSRCGGSLQTATVVPTPWWRKVLRFFQQRRVHPAGARPKRRTRLLTLRGLTAAFRRVLLVAALLAGLLYAISPSMRGVVNERVLAGKEWVESAISQKPVAVRPTSTAATAQLPDHTAEQATDLGNNTFWAAPDAAAKPKLVLQFDRLTRLVRAIVVNGGSGDEFQALGRPRDLHVVYFDGEIVTGTFDVTLEDKPDKQEVKFGRGDGATRVEIQVMSFYRSPQSPGLALSEIELFERR